MRRSTYRAVSIILMLAALLAVSVSCSPDAADIQETATLSVSISSSDNGKTIAPDDPDIGITHFRITISDGLGVNSVSDYISAGNSFIVSDLRIGKWTISAEGYAYVNSSYVLLAEGSTPVTLAAGENSVSVKLEPVDAAAGDVTVSLLLPSSFGDGSFSYWFWITDIDGNPVTISQDTGSSVSPLTGTAADGVGTFTISGLKQGGYLLYATVRDGEGKEYSAVEAMRLIAGIGASGGLEFPDESEGLSETLSLELSYNDLDSFNNLGKVVYTTLPIDSYSDAHLFDYYLTIRDKSSSAVILDDAKLFAIENTEQTSVEYFGDRDVSSSDFVGSTKAYICVGMDMDSYVFIPKAIEINVNVENTGIDLSENTVLEITLRIVLKDNDTVVEAISRK